MAKNGLRWRTASQDRPLKGLLILLLFLLPGLMAPTPVMASSVGAAPAASNAGSVASSVPLHRAKYPATLTLTQSIDTRGRIRLVATSNARYVVVVYRTAYRGNRKVTVRFRGGVARLTIPAGSTGILAQTKSTSRLAPSALQVALPALMPTPAPRHSSPDPVTETGTSAASQDSIILNWINPQDWDLQEILVYRSATAPGRGQPWDQVTVLPRNATAFQDVGLTPNTMYNYAIVTVDRYLNVGAAVRVMRATLPDTTPPGPVTQVVVGVVTRSSVALRWEGPVPPGDVHRVQVRRATGPRAPATTAEGTLVYDQLWSASNNLTDNGLTPGTQYSYSVFTLDPFGNVSNPVSVTTTTTAWATISAGDGQTCALDTRGAAWCWGSGLRSNGTLGSSSVPARVPGGLTFTSLTVGARHACALDPSGAAWCWGDDTEGALGDSAEALNQTKPVAVAGGHVFTALTNGDKFTCGLDRAGLAWCWGDNSDGALGDGTLTNRFLPVAVAGGRTYTRITAGDRRICAVDTAGAGWCWGLDVTSGRYATAITSPTAVPGGHVFTSMSTAWGLTCGIDPAGIAWCWGMNMYTGVGDGTSEYRTTPVRVAGDRIYRSLTSAPDRTCGLDTTGAVWCWGRALLGDGTGNNSNSPVAVTGGRTFVNVDAGYTQSCGVDTLGKALCWGYNSRAELGDGTYVDRSVPVEVAEPIG